MSEHHKPHAEAEQEISTILFYLTALGHIDGTFDPREREYLTHFLDKLVGYRARLVAKSLGAEERAAVVARWSAHFQEVFERTEHEVKSYFTESVPEGEDPQGYAESRLKLRCLELFQKFNAENQARLLVLADEMFEADGEVHPAEARFRQELADLLANADKGDESAVADAVAGSLTVEPPAVLLAREPDDTFFRSIEYPHSRNDDEFALQAEDDLAAVDQVLSKLDDFRDKGRHTLAGLRSVGELATKVGPGGHFHDGPVVGYVPDEQKKCEVIVLGDLHGCYSCIKAAVLQTDFLAKVEAHRADPEKNHAVKLVFLGDYVDRGRYSFDGVLRAALKLFLYAPEDVFLLRGNHEWYLEFPQGVVSGVRPAEAVAALSQRGALSVARAYKKLFDALPTTLLFGRSVYVHGGIPRADTLAERWKDLSSLKDDVLRFQLLWSDPSEADVVPLDLQKKNARFAFGRRQFRAFMQRLGATLMVRGHDRIEEGFRSVYDDPRAALFTLFSAGGESNDDLPPNSNYREVTPMGLRAIYEGTSVTLEPFAIDWVRYQKAEYNGFIRAKK